MENLIPVEEKPIRVVACPHPFRAAHEEYQFVPGMSLAEILAAVQPDILLRRRAHVWVNDLYIKPEKWESTYPTWGAEISIRVVPGGPVGRIIGSIFIAIAAIAAIALQQYWAIPLFGKTFGPFVAGLAALGVGIVGNMILNALIPPTTSSPARLAALSAVPGQLDYGETSNTLSITGAQNKENLYGPVPLILGRHKVFALYGARPYTESAGNDQYLRL
jgi:hypothetical protein